MTHYDELTDVWRSRNIKGYQHKIAGRGFLHENTKYLIEVATPALGLVESVHEIGCGMGRNLSYLMKAFKERGWPVPRVSGNDLVKKSCYEYMDGDLKSVLEFHEKDTLAFLKEQVEAGRKVDMLISSDHMIHLSPKSIKEVQSLIERFACKFIIYREATAATQESRKTATHWFVHDYRFDSFEIISTDRENKKDPHKEYEVTLLRNRDLNEVFTPPPESHVKRLEGLGSSPLEEDSADWIRARLERVGVKNALEIGMGAVRLSDILGGLPIEVTCSGKYRVDGVDAAAPEALPYEDGAFDAVVFNHSLTEVFDFDLALAAARRVLKPGGILLAVAEDGAFRKLARFSGMFGVRPAEVGSAGRRMVKLADVEKALASNGFAITGVGRYGPSFLGVSQYGRLEALARRGLKG